MRARRSCDQLTSGTILLVASVAIHLANAVCSLAGWVTAGTSQQAFVVACLAYVAGLAIGEPAKVLAEVEKLRDEVEWLKVDAKVQARRIDLLADAAEEADDRITGDPR